ncbi:MAG: acetolactate synthase small subunit [Candidatus Omnitrophica bacterium]|nr:acetolactate synthase small subunit [Candidatus Omnitrophota bacterium]
MDKKNNIHTISLLVSNKPGVLIRCAQVFARRGFNIDSLVVSTTINPKYSRMTITAQGDPETLDQIIKQSAKLIDVLHAGEHDEASTVTREYALIKIKSTPNTLPAIKKLAAKYKAKIVDQTSKLLIIEQAGPTSILNEFEEHMKKFTIVEMVRSGKLVMAKGQEAT